MTEAQHSHVFALKRPISWVEWERCTQQLPCWEPTDKDTPEICATMGEYAIVYVWPEENHTWTYQIENENLDVFVRFTACPSLETAKTAAWAFALGFLRACCPASLAPASPVTEEQKAPSLPSPEVKDSVPSESQTPVSPSTTSSVAMPDNSSSAAPLLAAETVELACPVAPGSTPGRRRTKNASRGHAAAKPEAGTSS